MLQQVWWRPWLCTWGWVHLVLLACWATAQPESVSFTVPTIRGRSRPKLAVFFGSERRAEPPGQVQFQGRTIEMPPPTPPTGGDQSYSSSTRVMFRQPVRFYEASSGLAASFATSFAFKLNPPTASDFQTEGLGGITFLLAPNSSVPGSSGGPNLGLFAADESGRAVGGRSYVVAVEIDLMNNTAAELEPIPSVGLDLESLNSTSSRYLWNRDELLNRTVATWIEYNATRQELVVSMVNVSSSAGRNSTWDRRQAVTVLAVSGLDLSLHLQEYCYVGFSASLSYRPSFVPPLDNQRAAAGSPPNLDRTTYEPANISIFNWRFSTHWSQQSQPGPQPQPQAAKPHFKEAPLWVFVLAFAANHVVVYIWMLLSKAILTLRSIWRLLSVKAIVTLHSIWRTWLQIPNPNSGNDGGVDPKLQVPTLSNHECFLTLTSRQRLGSSARKRCLGMEGSGKSTKGCCRTAQWWQSSVLLPTPSKARGSLWQR